MAEPDTEKARMSRADLITAVVLVVLGVAILYGSWTMPRLEARRIHPATIPGLVPGLLSIALIICGGLLGLRSIRTPSPGGWASLRAALFSAETARALAVTALILVFTLGLVGRMPFWAASAIFIFAFVMMFELWLTDAPHRLPVSLAWAAALAAIVSAAVFWVFQYQFLVRLPGS